jgi:MYXO-CTERM domain-containing protein
LSGTPVGNISSAKDAPAIAWIGGLLGAFLRRRRLLC